MKHFLTFLLCGLLSLPALATTVRFETSMGNFSIKLNEAKAPVTCKNFLRYVHDGSYDGSIFHRVIKGFVIQGGGFTKTGKQLPSYSPIKNESDNGLSNLTGTIAMARTADPDSATRQFYINVHDNPFLDGNANKPGYAVFGHVIKGMKTIQAIADVQTGYDSTLGMPNVPSTPVMINHVSVVNNK